MINVCNAYTRKAFHCTPLVGCFLRRLQWWAFKNPSRPCKPDDLYVYACRCVGGHWGLSGRLLSQKVRWLFSSISYLCTCSQILYLSIYWPESWLETFACFSVVWHLAVNVCFLSPLLLCPLNPGFKIVRFLKALVTCFTAACVGFQDLRKYLLAWNL